MLPMTAEQEQAVRALADHLAKGGWPVLDHLLRENERLTGQLEKCWKLLKLATIPMGIGPSAERLLKEHGQLK